MSKKQPAYFYGFTGTKPERVIVPDQYETESHVVQVMGMDGRMHALDGLRYNHKVSLLFRFKSKKAMQETEGTLGDTFKYRSRMFIVNERAECYPDEDGYWWLIISGEGQGKALYPAP